MQSINKFTTYLNTNNCNMCYLGRRSMRRSKGRQRRRKENLQFSSPFRTKISGSKKLLRVVKSWHYLRELKDLEKALEFGAVKNWNGCHCASATIGVVGGVHCSTRAGNDVIVLPHFTCAVFPSPVSQSVSNTIYYRASAYYPFAICSGRSL